MIKTIKEFLGDRRGATSIEYAMIASGIAVVIVAAISSLGTSVQDSYVSVDTALN